MTPEAPAAPETPAAEPTVEVPDAKPPAILLETGERMIDCDLTDAEVLAKADALVAEQEAIDKAIAVETRAKETAKAAKLSGAERMRQLGAQIRSRTEERLVAIEVRQVGSDAVTYRLDTGAEIDRRPLPLAPPAPPKPESTPEALRVLVVSALHALGASGVIRVAEELVHAEVVVAPSRVAEVLDGLAKEGLVEHDKPTDRWRLTKAGQVASAQIMAKVAAKDAPAAKTLGRAAEEPEEGGNEADRKRVLDALRGKELTRKEIVAATGLASEVVGGCLADLMAITGDVAKVGKGPGTRYARVLDAAAEPAPPTPPTPPPPPVVPSPADPFALAPGPRA